MKLTQVQKPKGSMTAAQIKKWLAGKPDSEVMRAILMREIKAVQSGEPRKERTIRGLWYFVVKSTLSVAGLLHKATSKGNKVDWPRKMSAYLAELVRAGVTRYRDLSIIDGSRQRQPARDVTAEVAAVKMAGAHYPWIILFIEKDTTWPVVQNLADLYGVSAVSGGGEPAFSCTEDIILRIEESEAAERWREDHDGAPIPLTLLSITDYDPAGYIIADAQSQQIEDVVGRKIMHERLGVEPSQLEAALIDEKAYELEGGKLLDEWLARTGGVNGQALGIELDVMPLDDLRQMYAKAIERYIDLEYRRQDLREAFIDLTACRLLLPDFETKRQAMIDAVKANETWSDIQAHAIPDDLFMRAAIEGNDWISTTETQELFAEFLAQVQAIMGDELT